MGYSTNRPPGWTPPNPEDKACEHGNTGPCTKCHEGCDRCEGKGFLENAYCDVDEEEARAIEGKFSPDHGDSLCPGPLDEETRAEDEREENAVQLYSDIMEICGVPWRKFTDEDWYGWGGAGLDAHIYYTTDHIYVRSVEDGVLQIEKYSQEHPSTDVELVKTWTFKVL